MNFKPIRPIIYGLFVISLTACATQKDLLKIQEDLYFLRNQIQSVKQTTEENKQLLSQVPTIADQCNQILIELDSLEKSLAELQDANDRTRADINTRLSSLKQDAAIISSKLDDASYRSSQLIGKVESLTGKMTNISEKIESRAATPNSAEPAPTEIFNNAYRDMTKGNIELAIQGFQTFLKLYPDKELADYCQYYLAEIAYQQEDYATAATEYKLLINNYPRSQKITNAHYKLGLCYLKLNNLEQARTQFETVIREYPNTEEALLARNQLQKLEQQ